MTKLHIDKVFKKTSSSPVVVNFQNGYATESFKVQNCKVLRNEENNEKTYVTQVGDLLYAGREEQEEIGKTLILARNRKTGKVRLIEVGNVEMKPVLKTNLDNSLTLETSTLELSRKFGSKKQKQQMEQREKLKVNAETVTEQMENVTKNISEDQLDLATYNKNDSEDFYIPPIDRTATKAEEVYEIDKILTEEEFEKIESEITDKDENFDLLPWIKNMVTAKTPIKHKILALYANCLIKLNASLMKDIVKKSFVICGVSQTLNTIVLNKFTTNVNGKILRPTMYKDKALCHAIVFLLLINNLKFDLDGLCQAIKTTPTTATLKVRVTGASVVASGTKKVVQLKLPLFTKSLYRRKSTKF